MAIIPPSANMYDPAYVKKISTQFRGENSKAGLISGGTCLVFAAAVVGGIFVGNYAISPLLNKIIEFLPEERQPNWQKWRESSNSCFQSFSFYAACRAGAAFNDFMLTSSPSKRKGIPTASNQGWIDDFGGLFP